MKCSQFRQFVTERRPHDYRSSWQRIVCGDSPMEIRAGFEPATNSFADCPLEPLEYRIMLVIRTGLEPVLQP